MLRRSEPIAVSSWWCSSTATSWAAASSSRRNGPSSAASRAARTLLDDAARLEDGHLLGPLGRREAVGDEDAGAPRDEPVGGPDHSRLGDRVHAGRGLVEDDDAHVAHEQPGERHELLLARREGRAARAEHRVQTVGQPGHPLGQAQLCDRRLDPGPRHVTEERHVLREGAGEHLGALGDDADRGPQLLQVEVAHVGAAQQHRAAGRLHGSRQQRGERGLARAGAADERAGVPGPDDEIDVPQGEGACAVAELEVAELHLELPVAQGQPADRLRRGGEHGPQPQDRAEALLQVGEVTRQHVDAADEHRRDEEEGDQPGGRQVAGEHEGGADDRDGGQRAVEQPAAAPGDPGLDPEHLVERRVDPRGHPGVAAQHVGLAQCGAQVVAGGDALLGGGCVVGPRGFLDHLAFGDLGQQPADDRSTSRVP